jgi:hypothetical protein
MPSIVIAMNTGAIYNLRDVIRGTVTTGITLTPTTGTRPGQPANVDRLLLRADPTNGAKNVAYGDAGIATDGSSGRVMLAGDEDIFQGRPCPSLNRYLAVSASGAKLEVVWD